MNRSMKVQIIETPSIKPRARSQGSRRWNWNKVLSDLEDVPAKQITFGSNEEAEKARIAAIAWWSYNSTGQRLRTHVDELVLILWVEKE